MIWFCVFVMLFMPVVCLASVVVGAYVMYCRQHEENPMRAGIQEVLPWLAFEREESGVKRIEEEERSFYS
ncbi:MAG: hypothetical protein AB7V08_14685 [Elusimicrobiales bacterium]